MDLVLLLDLKSEVSYEDVHQRRGDVIEARVKGCSKAGIKWNKIHPGGMYTCARKSSLPATCSYYTCQHKYKETASYM